MIALIRKKHETVKGVKDALAEFETLLDSSGSMLIPQAPVSSGAHAEFTRERAGVFREGEEPWRPVRLLFVLGFSEGRYPAGPERSPVFDDRDVATLKNDHGYALETAQEGMARRRALFERQIRSAADQAVFLSPLRDPLGRHLGRHDDRRMVDREGRDRREGSPHDEVIGAEAELHADPAHPKTVPGPGPRRPEGYHGNMGDTCSLRPWSPGSGRRPRKSVSWWERCGSS